MGSEIGVARSLKRLPLLYYAFRNFRLYYSPHSILYALLYTFIYCTANKAAYIS